RAGKSVGTFEVADVSNNRLAELMVGRHVDMRLDKPEAKLGKTTLKVSDLKVKNKQGILTIKGLSFNLRAGEILGVAGIDGNG
ncbi:MAG: heme ABC transporter ATP-binding protein, partial [Lactobacillus sp.]|nr:heme ABC transporter ATP-binding protein [Lactobacillus sp.]